MLLGIDASNIRTGGGVTHLTELLRAAKPRAHGFDRVVVWSSSATLAAIDYQPWLEKVHDGRLDGPLWRRAAWQRFRLGKLAVEAGCDLLFIPGGSDTTGFHPSVAMNQNLLPFEWREFRRYGLSGTTLKFALLRIVQSRTFRRADGMIYLSDYARDTVSRIVKSGASRSVVIPHGINARFRIAPRPQRAASEAHPLRLLYVSIVDVYKHQWRVAEAVAKLRAEGVPVSLDLVGPPGHGTARLERTLDRVDPQRRAIRYLGAVPYGALHDLYAAAEVGIFASTCETFGQILTEAMCAGLAIASSDRGPMPELLGDAGVYFDPENEASIGDALRRLIASPQLRAAKAQAAFERSRLYSWERCSEDTFRFFAEVARDYRGSRRTIAARRDETQPRLSGH
jgi:glycosyltransferase involved in cell wall biosynthesis